MLMLHQDTKQPGPLRPRNQARLYLYWKKGGVFKYPKLFQCGNGPEFKSEVTKFLEKQNVNIRRTTTKYKYTHTVEAFNKEMVRQF